MIAILGAILVVANVSLVGLLLVFLYEIYY